MSEFQREARFFAELPVMPLREVVMLPRTIMPLFVGREASIKAIELAQSGYNKQMFLVAQREPDVEKPGADDLSPVGVVCKVLQMLRLPDGTIKVLFEGLHRARWTGLREEDNCLMAMLCTVPESESRPEEREALVRTVQEALEEYAKNNKKLTQEALMSIMALRDAGPLADAVVPHLKVDYRKKQEVLEIADVTERLERVYELLQGEVALASVEKRIKNRVKVQMERNQREYYLSEQLKAINKEMGREDDPQAEVDELEKKLEGRNMPQEARERCQSELRKLRSMPPSAAEYTVVRNYVDWLLDLPWNDLKEIDIDIEKARAILEGDHFGLEKVKERILEILAVRQLNTEVKGQIICLVGPPGVGKTSIARSIAESLNRKYVRLSLGGVRDEAEIRGHRRTYIGAMPGKIISAMITAKSSNPLMLLDEIDKLAGDFRGDPAAALLEALDPEQNSTFNDHFIDMPFDLSHVLFITTANDLSAIPGPLRDRMDVIELPSYTRVEKYNIARKHLVPKQLDACGLTGKVAFSQSALYGIIDGYTREAGVRNLERTITSVLRKCARKIASGEAENVSVTGTSLEKLLGPRMVKPEFLNRTNAIGIANGLAWTSIGGETLPIEVQVIDNGSGKITVTGSLGDVMKESAQLAITYARVHAAEYGIDPERLKKCDLHIHAPEGAVPKDGPSAGVTLTTALISCLSGIPVRGDVAMTGEITLHGNVLPIGGLREKSMAAYREGMKTVLIPKDNLSDLYEVDDEVKKNIEFLPMSNLSQVLAAALLKPKTVSAGHPRAKKGKPAEAAALPQPTEKPQTGAVC